MNSENVGQLVEVQCGDAVRLNGFLQDPLTDSDRSELWIIVHGVAGNFYSSALLAGLSRTVRMAGCHSLRINTRGHDQIAFAASGALPTLVGSAFESIADAVQDLDAWLQFARQHGFKRVGLLGHSLGAIKSAYFTIHANTDGEVTAPSERLILISPPRLHHQSMLDDARFGDAYRRDLAAAEKAMQEGEPDRLLRIRFPQPLTISAGTFLDKYGPSSLYDYLSWADQLPQATWIFGEREVRGQRKNFCDCDRMLAKCIEGKTQHSVEVIADADHNYNGVRDTLYASVLRAIS